MLVIRINGCDDDDVTLTTTPLSVLLFQEEMRVWNDKKATVEKSNLKIQKRKWNI